MLCINIYNTIYMFHNLFIHLLIDSKASSIIWPSKNFNKYEWGTMSSMDSLEEIQECTQKHYGGSYVSFTFIKLRKLLTDIGWVNLYLFKLCFVVQRCVIFVCKKIALQNIFCHCCLCGSLNSKSCHRLRQYLISGHLHQSS